MLQILDPAGNIVNDTEFKKLGLTFGQHKKIYRTILRNRYFTERAMSVSKSHEEMNFLYISNRGSEPAEVASAYALWPDDLIEWYSRSQGPALMRGVSVETLYKHFYGADDESVVDDLLKHKLMTPFILVGTPYTYANGYTWGKMLKGERSIGVSYTGDGATAQGDFHSAINWAAIEDKANGKPKFPTIFICINNLVAISVPWQRQTGTKTLAEKAAAYMATERVDGLDPLAVYAATKRARDRSEKQKEPTFLEFLTFRAVEHTNKITDQMYQTRKKELDYFNTVLDPLIRYSELLINYGENLPQGRKWTKEEDNELRESIREEIVKADQKVREVDYPATIQRGSEIIARNVKLYNEPRVGVKYKEPQDFSGFNPPIYPNAKYVEAVALALHDAMLYDSDVMALGQDIAEEGSVLSYFCLPKQFVLEHLGTEYHDKLLVKGLPLMHIFGPERVFNTPLDEAGTAGHAIGLAMAGMRVVLETQFSGFKYDMRKHMEVAGRLIHRTVGRVPMPITNILPCGGGPQIEFHREFQGDEDAVGISPLVVIPSTPKDAYDLLFASITEDVWVQIYLDKMLNHKAEIREGVERRLPEKSIREFGSRVVKPGTDVTMTAYGRYVHICKEVADKLQSEKGVSVEVIDVRVFNPLDEATLVNSFAKTGRLIVVQEEPGLGTGGLIIDAIFGNEKAFQQAKAPRVIVRPPRSHFPIHSLHELYLPQKETIEKAALETVEKWK